MKFRWAVLFVQTLGQVPRSRASPTTTSSSTSTGPFLGTPQDAVWYDWGWYGLHPEQHYESFGASPPRPYLLQQDERCSSITTNKDDDGQDLVFVGPRGLAVTTPGPIVYDTRGHLVWMDTRWGEAMDFKVQRYNGESYLTFWHGTDNGTFGEGQYYMLNASYDVVRTVKPAPTADGTQLLGDLHDFVITEAGTALMTIYQTRPRDMTAKYGIESGWIFDSLFQEVDIATGQLVFQWRASDHFAVQDTFAPLKRGFGKHAAKAFDFFHINSVAKMPNKDGRGDYIVSSRYMCAVICVSGTTGDVLWQLGGRNNSFEDLSDGQATNLHWQHHAVWHEDTQELSVFDNGAYDKLETAEYSRGMRIRLGLDSTPPTVELVQAYVAPQKLLAQSQGSVQVLSETDTVLVGWGHIPAYTEFDSKTGSPLCDVHLCPLGFAALGWCKNYRTAKHHWVGKPSTLPSIAMRPAEHAVYVSWNGATEVRSWQLQTRVNSKSEFVNHGPAVAKNDFEARLDVPSSAKTVRIAALDRHGKVLAYSEAVSTAESTVVAAMAAPPPKETLRGRLLRLASYITLGVVAGCVLAYLVLIRYRAATFAQARRVVCVIVAAASRVLPSPRNYRYEALPTATPVMVEMSMDSRSDGERERGWTARVE